MSFMEIALLVLGVIIFVVSFLLPEDSNQVAKIDPETEREEVQKIVNSEIDGMRLRVNEATNDTIDSAVDRAERSLEKVSNEKIMAVSEYANTVIEEINKNHKEVMFLYDMLSDKQTELTNIVRKADATAKEIGSVSHSAQMASETLLRGMSVATVSQKGLTSEQKAIFDDIVIPDPVPTVGRSSLYGYQAGHTSEDTIGRIEYVANAGNSVKQVASHQTENNQKNSFENDNALAETASKGKAKGKKGASLTQSKIFADLANLGKADEIEYVSESGNDNDSNKEVAPKTEKIDSGKRQKVAKDILSGSTYQEGTIVGVDMPAGRAVTAADFAALVNGTTGSADYTGVMHSSNIVSNSQTTGGFADNKGVLTQAPANNNDLIIEMSKQGMSTVEIAKTLKLGVGEVKLVLDLFR